MADCFLNCQREIPESVQENELDSQIIMQILNLAMANYYTLDKL